MAATDAIGKPLPPQTVVLERGPLTNFARAVKDENPVYRDPEAARAAGFENLPAPPTYPFAWHHWGSFPDVQPEGADASDPVIEVMGELLADGGLILHGEQEFAYVRQPVAGDVLTARGTVKDVYTKTSSSGRKMTFIVTETEWLDEDGSLVATSTMTVLHRA